ncbi:hypothetical protein M3Y99_01390900 [Aphelenchoides fujianensis]|nr:hypothetical protein M3Y99_01390900 [Aphelenchoides fujianensis]
MISSTKLRTVGKVGSLAIVLLTAALFVWPSGKQADVAEFSLKTSFPPVNGCDCEGEDFCFAGLDAEGRTVRGRPFDCALLDGLRRFGLTRAAIARTPAVHERPAAEWTPRFVSALSSDHFAEGHRLEVLQEHAEFFYVDSSFRLTGRNLGAFPRAVREGRLPPFSTHSFAPHSVFSTTHFRMYDFLPLPFSVLQMSELQASPMFVSDAPYTREALKWFFLCAMTEECIAPRDAVRHCPLKEVAVYAPNVYLNCHRFDQTFWNLFALAQLFGERRAAVSLGYTPAWSVLNVTVVERVERNRRRAMEPLFRLVELHRSNSMRDLPNLGCNISTLRPE